MAILSSDSLSLEVRLTGFHLGWIQYEVGFLWSQTSLVNDALLKRSTDDHRHRTPGYFLIEDYIGDRDPSHNDLVKTIEAVLQSGQPQYWETAEIGEVLAFYPSMFFPFIDRQRHFMPDQQLPVSSVISSDRSEAISRHQSFTVIAFIDTFNLEGGLHDVAGLALHLRVERQALEAFRTQLEQEYHLFRERYNPHDKTPNANSAD